MPESYQPGDTIAEKYRVEDLLGEGGMGVVLAAVDTQLDRPVAIKILSAQHAQNAQVFERFVQEARAAARLESEHVVRIYDVGTLPDGRPVIVMEKLRGADLGQVLETEHRLAVQDAVGFVIEASEGIAEAHLCGIVHRDLKPANLFLARMPDGTSRIKVVDFGVSKMAARGDTSLSLTATSLVLGSPIYMSPEQLRSPRDVDARADVWALGTILHELITGEPPFLAESITELSAKILLESLPPPDERVPTPLPGGLGDVVRKALAKDRDLRYGSVAELVVALAPYAPPRSRELVHRIARMQNVSEEERAALPEIPRRSTPLIPGIKSSGKTPTTFGSTVAHEHGSRTKRNVLVAMATALVVGGVIGIAAMTGQTRTDAFVPVAAGTPRILPSAEDRPIAPKATSQAAWAVPGPDEQQASAPSSSGDAGSAKATAGSAKSVPAARRARPTAKAASNRTGKTSHSSRPEPLVGWDRFGDRK
ncbi:MAG: protein kinase [Polyangiaceae bacterium]|nr:protein kinase [Polyangiaceae bacterium]